MDGVGLGTFDNLGHTGWTWIKHTQTINLSAVSMNFIFSVVNQVIVLTVFVDIFSMPLVPAGEGPPESLRTGPDTRNTDYYSLSSPRVYLGKYAGRLADIFRDANITRRLQTSK